MQTPTNSPVSPANGSSSSDASKTNSAPPQKKVADFTLKRPAAAPPATAKSAAKRDNRPLPLRLTLMEQQYQGVAYLLREHAREIAELKKELKEQSAFLRVRSDAMKRILRFLGTPELSTTEEQQAVHRLLSQPPDLVANEAPLSPSSGSEPATPSMPPTSDPPSSPGATNMSPTEPPPELFPEVQ
jgi:hypothetical protein